MPATTRSRISIQTNNYTIRSIVHGVAFLQMVQSIRSRTRNININVNSLSRPRCFQLQHFLDRFILPAAAASPPPPPSGSTTVRPRLPPRRAAPRRGLRWPQPRGAAPERAAGSGWRCDRSQVAFGGYASTSVVCSISSGICFLTFCHNFLHGWIFHFAKVHSFVAEYLTWPGNLINVGEKLLCHIRLHVAGCMTSEGLPSAFHLTPFRPPSPYNTEVKGKR